MPNPADTFVQVAADSTGKRVEMSLVSSGKADTAGAAIDTYRQRAELTGVSQDAVDQLLAINKLQLSTLQAILAVLNGISNFSVQAEDFPPDSPT